MSANSSKGVNAKSMAQARALVVRMDRALSVQWTMRILLILYFRYFVLSNILNFKTLKCFFIYFFEPTAISHTG